MGIDGIAGPSELVVVAAGDGADPELVALDLLAQAEHGADSPLVAASRPTTRCSTRSRRRSSGSRPSARAPRRRAPARSCTRRRRRRRCELAEAIAPEHLELVGEEAEALADRVRCAGCVFVGRGAATAFGDYVAGSNHVLPTGGAARFQRRSRRPPSGAGWLAYRCPPRRAARLAPAGAALARAEGFPVHAESMERRA